MKEVASQIRKRCTSIEFTWGEGGRVGFVERRTHVLPVADIADNAFYHYSRGKNRSGKTIH